MVRQTDEVVELYKDLCKLPAISSARISNAQTAGHVQVQSYWTQRDLERKEKVKFCRTHIVQLDYSFSAPPTEINNEQWCKESPSGKYRAVVRSLKDKKGDDKQFIDIWTHSQKVQTVAVSGLDQHGKIYDNDGIFGSFEWNQAETHLLYIAEKKRPKSKSFFEKKSTTTVSTSEEETRGDDFVWRDTWGEQMVEKSAPVVCVLDIESGTPSVLDNIPDNVSAAQAIWSPDDMGVVCVGYYHDPYRLGIIYCPIRKSALFYIDLKTSQCTMIGSNDKAIRTPVFSPDRTKLIYLEHEIGGPHMQCAVLKMIDWSTKGIVTVVDRVHKAVGPDFPGICLSALNNRCWANDNKRVFMQTFWRSKQELVVVDTDTGEVRRVTEDASIGSWTLQDVRNDIIVASCSSPCSPDHMVIAQVPESGKEQTITWKPLDEGSQTVSGINWRLLKCDVSPDRRHPKYDYLDYECILLEPEKKPDDTTKPPLVAFPHGGPHSLIVASFALSTASLVKAGYAVLIINYRGSIGFGQDSIDCLPGNVGTLDVNDCQDAVEKVLAMDIVDRERVVVTGGSHGGFLTTHLIGQFPDVYKAAVARNPVINIACKPLLLWQILPTFVTAGTTTKDAPDLTNVECGLPFDIKKTSSPEAYAKMWNMSPIRYVDNVKTPMLVVLGEQDLRVPPSQGLEFHKALLARGVETRCLSYPGNNHPIAQVDAEADHFINMVKWFNTHIGAE